MNRKKLNIIFQLIIGCCSVIFLSSCQKKSLEGMIVFTQVAGELQDVNYTTGKSWRYIANSRIVTLNPSKSNDRLKVLTENYFSANSPEISFDGKFMIFSAQKNQHDIWQIWEMNLENLKAKQVTFSSENCIDPAYLPNGRLVFSKFKTSGMAHKEHALFTCNNDGSDVKQITFNPHAYFASKVLKDGRILTISKELYPTIKDGNFMVLRPDGTKEELFYQGGKGSNLHSRGWETTNGKVIFIESDGTHEGGNIISVNYNRPLDSRVNLSSSFEGDFYSISAIKDNKLLISYRSSTEEPYALFEFDIAHKTLSQPIYKNKNYHVLEAVVVEKKERPRDLPSEVNMNSKTGMLLCQDINFSDILSDSTPLTSKAIKVEVMGIKSSLGIVDVEKDGSFYLKVLADIPFRLKTIDKNGLVVNGPSSWIYLRPNERRGCVGCHENKDQIPDNRQLMSSKKDPILIPDLEIYKNKEH